MFGKWMEADPVAKTSIVWMMTREDFSQEKDKTSMLNILMDHGSGPSSRDGGPAATQLLLSSFHPGSTYVLSLKLACTMQTFLHRPSV